MPRPRERDANDKIKKKGPGRIKKDMRRQMTAKLRKELAQRSRGGEETPDAQAVSQTDQLATAAVEEVGEQAGRTIGRAADTLRKHDQQKKQDPTRTRDAASRPQASGELCPIKTGVSDTEAPAPPTPQERMRRLAVEERQAQAAHTQPAQLTPPAVRPTPSPSCGSAPPISTPPQGNRSLQNRSINRSIKEHLRSTTGPKEKPGAGVSAPKTRQRVKATAQKRTTSAKISARTPPATAPMERARRRVQQAAQRKLGQRAKQTTRAAADLSKKAAVAVTKAVAALVSSLAALVGGGVLVAALCVVLLIAAVMASPFGLLFSNEPSPGAVPLNAAVAEINIEYTDRLADLQDGGYDSISIQGQTPDWREVAAVFAAKTAGADDGVDVAALTPDRVDRLRAVFWDMCTISARVETIDHPASGSTGAWTERILHITITARTVDEMRTAYSFTQLQNDALTELLAEMDTLGTLLGDLSVSQADALALLQNLPADLSPERRAVVEAACSLVGKVNYFWGGKSLVIGWDSRWGTLREVTATGSSTTGTYRPYGLDCSGYVDWVFYNITGGEYIIGHGGGAHAQHTYCAPITWAEAQPGDLVFYPEDSHVGIVGGWDESGNIQIIHCASGQNNVVITGKAGFTTIGRPDYFSH